MLLSLSIRDFVIVDELELEFGPGFTVLSGETGAGKSILIDALLLALGERGDADVVREGAARADVTATFRAGAEAAAWLAAHDLGEPEPTGDEALYLRRVVDAAGRGKGYINGRPVPLAQLRELGELLVDVHGQHAHQSLLRAGAQLQMLDEHAGAGALARDVAAAWQALRRAQRARDDARAMAESALAEQDRLRWVVDELTDLAPEPGEWERVQSEHKRLSHAAHLLEGARGAVDALAENDGAAISQLDGVIARIGQLASYDPSLAAIRETLEAARIHADDAARALSQYLDRADLDDARLAAVDARVGALHAAGRKLRCAPDALPQLLEASRRKLQDLAASADIERLEAAVAEATSRFDASAALLSQARIGAAGALEREVTRAMQDLSMAGGRFQVELTAAEPSATGVEKVEFRVAGHAGVAPRALARIASGGELARISLAIAVIAATATPVATLIFDEVDAGIGGAVAETVGRLLRQLGQMRQVLCVTHLPQVAARGDHHLAVSKATAADGRPVSRITRLERKERVEEIARMLGGLELTDTTRKHAREMLVG
ncbi:MAG TPA: DNA repair protein RecN [Burkholderiaceae bacterium]|nr:DNA repair protein RecN [Burkholderiaceae bacterium]